ncbi:hypothetical protein P3T27_006605 [Kitasatospora sp. MAA19]|uniref:hypothetical protein n=1 Tax=Kitasatospora sp. MAA19 TaxID=3035090 RepID=UPI0024733BCE|nr:hypothetical protein [Kitasatospora sp. MAA19]MDH6709856.1 hypothetical protein [Kitasatospora sp. MAA19]
MTPIISHEDTLLDLYTRYSCRLLAAATECLAEIGPDATSLDEDITQDVWEAVAAGHYPDGRRGLDGLLDLLDSAVRRVRAARVRQWPTGLPRARRRVDSTDLETYADQVDTVPARPRPLRPVVTSVAVAGLAA